MDLTLIPLASTAATIFYIVGGSLAALALIVSAIGVKSEGFPGNNKTAMGVIAVFAFFVVGSAAYAVLSARDEQKERREHLAEAEGHGEKKAEGAPAGEEGDSSEPAPEEKADDESGPVAEVTLSADAEGALSYDTDLLRTKAGEILFNFANPASVPHDVVIAKDDVVVADSDLISDDTTEFTADLGADSYTFYCSVPGHREAGMEGTIEVK